MGALSVLDLGRKDNGHDDAINGNDFAENNRDQVLGSDSRGPDGCAENRRAGDENTPAIMRLLVNVVSKRSRALLDIEGGGTDQAAPTTDKPMQRAIPVLAHVKGETLSRKAPTLKDSPLPVKSISR